MCLASGPDTKWPVPSGGQCPLSSDTEHTGNLGRFLGDVDTQWCECSNVPDQRCSA